MNIPQQLVHCPECSCPVRSDRLKRHLGKVHGKQRGGESQFNLEKSKVAKSLTRDEFKQVSYWVDSWLRRYQDYLYKPNNVTILTIMALEKFMGYGSNEIEQFYSGKINWERYEVGSKRLSVTYKWMIEHLHRVLIHHSKHPIDRAARNQHNTRTGNARASSHHESDVYADWYDCNSVDRTDATKYRGYFRREYENSWFGSYPIHDDYSEESWADGNSWE